MPQPHIGTFTLNIGEIMENSNKESHIFLSRASEIIKQLHTIVKKQEENRNIKVAEIMGKIRR